MKWIRIAKENSNQPAGVYTDWKPLLADEGQHQCVYCAIGEAAWGGTRNFHVEHFRPKSIFENLENDFRNLYYACCVCNTFKGDDWPGEPDDSLATARYADPSLVDYNDVFQVNPQGVVTSTSVAGRYMEVRLYLNRPQLILERREAELCERFDHLQQELESLVAALLLREDATSRELLGDVFTILSGIAGDLRTRLNRVRPYEEADLRRKS